MNNLLQQILKETQLLCEQNPNADYERYVQLADLRESLRVRSLANLY